MVRGFQHRGRRAGMSLVEMCVVLSLVGMTFVSLLSLGRQSTRLVDTGIGHSELEAQARRALDRISREMSGASAESLAALPESLPGATVWQESADFERVVDIRADDGRVTWSASRVELRYAPEEVDDGVDNDGNGLVDEGLLVLVLDVAAANEFELVLARNVAEHLEGEIPGNFIDDNGNGLVDERGACFERRGDEVRLYLSLQGVDGERHPFTRTLTTTVLSRN